MAGMNCRLDNRMNFTMGGNAPGGSKGRVNFGMHNELAQGAMSRAMQLQQINALSFAVDDASLFLDTHPDNAEAMRYFLDANMQRRNALNAYQAQFGPLFIDSVTGQGWSWETEKWPWEGGY